MPLVYASVSGLRNQSIVYILAKPFILSAVDSRITFQASLTLTYVELMGYFCLSSRCTFNVGPHSDWFVHTNKPSKQHPRKPLSIRSDLKFYSTNATKLVKRNERRIVTDDIVGSIGQLGRGKRGSY